MSGFSREPGLAEREGFEPPIPVKVCLISSQVHSTALPSLRVFVFNNLTIPPLSCFVQCDRFCGASPAMTVSSGEILQFRPAWSPEHVTAVAAVNAGIDH